MPEIVEEGRVRHVTQREADWLVELGLIARCIDPDCMAYHHEDFERWEEITERLAISSLFVPRPR